MRPGWFVWSNCYRDGYRTVHFWETVSVVLQHQPTTSYDMRGSLQEDVLPVDGVGKGVEQFALTLTWSAVSDLGPPAYATADLLFNGAPVWSVTRQHQNDLDPYQHTEMFVVDQSFTFGVPFSFQADVGVSGNGFTDSGQYELYSSAQLTVTLSPSLPEAPPPVPEPGTLPLVVSGSGILTACSLRPRRCRLAILTHPKPSDRIRVIPVRP